MDLMQNRIAYRSCGVLWFYMPPVWNRFKAGKYDEKLSSLTSHSDGFESDLYATMIW